MNATTPSVLGVVVPATDEERTVAGCLAAVRAAAARLPDGIGWDLVLVADSCRDRTVARAQHAGARTLTGRWRNVGRARAAGAADLLARWGADRLWLAFTDADSWVPGNWLAHHHAVAAQGWHALAGTVELADDADEQLAARFRAHYRPTAGHAHAHGANLGVSAAAYQHVGGFAPDARAEDATLLSALRRHGFSVLASTVAPVRTSARPRGHAPDGFAADLRALRTSGVHPHTGRYAGVDRSFEKYS